MSTQPSAYYTLLSRDGDFERRLAARVSWTLERMIWGRALSCGALVGTERSLAQDLCVSRATLCEALHILRLRGAIEVYRGNGGGIRVTIPDLVTVAQALDRYLGAVTAAREEFREVETILHALAADVAHRPASDVLLLWVDLLAASQVSAGLCRDVAPKAKEGCRARTLADVLIRQADEKRRIGSEWEICERFSVDRRIARQAVRILQESGLAAPGRGRGNGVRLVEPRPGTMLRAPYSFFAARKLDAEPCNLAIEHLNVAIARLAARRCTSADAAKLVGIATRIEGGADDGAMMDAMETVFATARNKVLATVLRCLLAYVARAYPAVCTVPNVLRDDFRLAYAAVARAIASGDEALAVDAQWGFHAVLHRVSAHASRLPTSQI